MNKIRLPLFPSFIMFLTLMAATAWISAPILHGVPWGWGIFAAVILCLAAVLFHARAKRRMKMDASARATRRASFYITGYFINAVSSGCAIGTLYAQLSRPVDLKGIALTAVPSILLAFAFCLIHAGNKQSTRKFWSIVIIVLSAILGAASIPAIFMWDSIFGSFSLFASICQLFFLWVCSSSAKEPEEKWHYLSYSGFWAFAIITLIVILVLSDGDALDGLDGLEFSNSADPKRKNKVKSKHSKS